MPRSMKISLALAAVAAVLLGYILFFERGSLSSGELEQRKQAALPEFVRARVSRVEIQRKGGMTVLERDPEDTDEAGLWRVTTPFRARADSETVNTLLGELEFLDARRTLKGVSAADKKQFGLAAPRARVWFTVGKTRVPVLVGNETARGDGIYVQGADPTVAFVVGKDLIEALEHDPGDYHTKEMHDGVYVSTMVELAFHDTQSSVALRKQADGTWLFQPPLMGLGSTPAVHEVIEAVGALRAKHFVEQDAKDLARYGLTQPQFELTLTKKAKFDSVEGRGDAIKPKPGEKPKPEESRTRVRIGNPCPDHVGESYLMIDDVHTVNCVADADLAKIRKPVADLREGRLLPFDDDELTALRIERAGRKLVLSKTASGFSYELTRPGATVLKGDARADAMADWLKALRAAKADRFEPQEASAATNDADTLRFHVDRAEGKSGYDVRIDASRSSELLAQREGEALAMILSPSILPLLEVSTARFRKLDVLHLEETSLRGLELRRGGTVERIARPNAQAKFAVVAPVQAAADSVELSELARLLGSLEAVRFVADAPEAAHGLAAPWITIAIDFAEKEPSKAVQHATLAIGNEAEGGRYAQLAGQPGVFVASPQLAQRVDEPLVSRTLLAVPLERLTALEFEQAGRRVRVERHADDFTGASEPKLQASAARAAAEAVATLRASHVTGYGPAETVQGMNRPFATVAVSARAETGGAEQHFVIMLGAEAPAGGRYARRDDQQVGFILPKASVDALVAPLVPLATR